MVQNINQLIHCKLDTKIKYCNLHQPFITANQHHLTTLHVLSATLHNAIQNQSAHRGINVMGSVKSTIFKSLCVRSERSCRPGGGAPADRPQLTEAHGGG